MTAEIVNLNKFRKARDKAEAEQRAAQNRVRYGRTRAEKDHAAAEERIKDRALDGSEITQRGVATDDGEIDPGAAS